MTRNLQQAVETTLQGYGRFGVDLGLERIERLLAALGNPQQRVPVIHVAGTNGKGSVCAYLSSVLTAAGYKTGRYTSPHLVNWTERICIDNQPISWDALAECIAEVEATIAKMQAAKMQSAPSTDEAHTPTQFEVFTAAAWLHFAQQKVDVAVVEVGLGGRLDATNVCDRPLATVIVSIGMDHWQRLGPTLADIAREKAGIFKPGVAAIAGPLPAEARAVVAQRAAELNAPLQWVQPAQLTPAGNFISNGIEYPQSLLGEHQAVNSACAIAAVQTLRQQGWEISNRAIAQGMGAATWPGRLQQYQWQQQPLLIDGAHNAAAAQALRCYIDQTFPDTTITWLMGMLETKDHTGVFGALLRSGDRLHLVPVPGHLSADPQVLAAIAQELCPALSICQTHSSLETALPNAIAQQPTVLCGSLYLIGHFYAQEAPASLSPT